MLEKVLDLRGPPHLAKVVVPEVSKLFAVRRHVEPAGVLDAIDDVLALAVVDHAV